MLKIIKEENLGDANYLILHAMDGLRELQKLQKSRNFYRIKNEEQGGNKYKISNWLEQYVNVFGVRKPRIGFVFGDCLTKFNAFLVKQRIYRKWKLSKFQCADMASQGGTAPLWA